MILTAVMLFPITSLTALASSNELEVQGSNTALVDTNQEVEVGNYTIDEESSIVEDSTSEVTVDNNASDITEKKQETIEDTTEQSDNQQSENQTDSLPQSNEKTSDDSQTVTTDSEVDKTGLQIGVTGPAAVTNLNYQSLNYKTIKLTWDVSEGATEYAIYVAFEETGSYEKVTSTSSTSYESKVSCGKIYYYKVVPYADVIQGAETVIKVNTKPEKASGLSATVKNTTVKLSWKKGKGAESYAIYRSEKKNTGFEKITETKKLKYSDKNLKQGKTYYYKIYSVSNQTESAKALSSKALRIPKGPKAVKSLKYKAENYKTITLSWKASKGATKYVIYRSTTQDGSYKKVKTTSSTSYKNKVSCGKIYYYKVVPYADSLMGTEKIIKAYTKPDKITKLKARVVDDTTVKLTWKKAKGASSYYVYRSTNKNKDFTKIGETKSAKYYDSNLTPNVTYYYRIYSVSNGTKGTKSACSVTIPQGGSGGIDTSDNMRAVWISYLDYDTLKDKSESEFTKNINAIYDTVLAQNINTVIVHVRAFGDAIYPSGYYKWANFITSDSDGPDYDPLKIMVEEAHKKGLSFQAWINPYRTSDGGRVNPASSSAVKKIVGGVEEIVRNYDIDGIHFDDYFYLSTDSTSQSVKMKNVNNMIRQVYAKIKSIKSNVLFGISPAGNIEYAQSIGCDVDTWLSESGYVDYICPQLYWSDDYVTKSGVSTKMFTNTMKQWTSINQNNTALYAGLALYKVGVSLETAWGNDYGWGNSTSNLYNQYKSAKSAGYAGYSLYRYGSFSLPAAKKELANLKKLSQ